MLCELLGVLQPRDLLSTQEYRTLVGEGQVGIGQLQQVPWVVQAGSSRQHVHMDAFAVVCMVDAQRLGQHGAPVTT